MRKFRYTEKDKKELKVFIRYFQFYGVLILTMSLISYGLDLIFIKAKTGSFQLHYNLLQYITFYIIIGYFIFPLSLLYNYFINQFSKIILLRILLAIGFLLVCGLLLNHKYHFGYLIGQYRVEKNILAMIFSGIGIEMIRHYIVKQRYNKI